MASVLEFVSLLVSQDGDKYVFGHEVSPDDANPSVFDCSELVEWGCARLKIKPKVPDGSWRQFRHCKKEGTDVAVERAILTSGALLFRFKGDPETGGRPEQAHVAVSLGNGMTIEARGKAYGVGIFSAEGRGWTHAGLVPGLVP
jgi:cell wall-associated NlpC family hydrolase